MVIFKSKKFKIILSLLIAFLLTLSNFQKANCVDFFPPDESLTSFFSDIPEVDKAVEKRIRKYHNIISAQYLLGDEYSAHLLEWRRKVMRLYFKFKRQNMYSASYFIWAMFLRKSNPYLYLPQRRTLRDLEKLNGLVDIKTYLVTPTHKSDAPLPSIADDPNGSIQSIFYYENRDPQVICI